MRLSLCITSTVKIKKYSSKMELICLYSGRSQVRRVEWKHHNESRKLKMSSSSLGTITTSLPLPITSDIAGNYTCVLHLKNGQAIQATQAITVSPKVVKNFPEGWCVFWFSLGSLLYNIHNSPGRLPVCLGIINHECGCFPDICSTKRSMAYLSQPQVSSSAREPRVYRDESSWQIPYVMLS